jgi:hypothetical protein
MSQENVEIVRRFAVAMNGDVASIEAAVAELFEEDSDYYPVRKFPDARPSHGREEFADWMTFFYEGFPRLNLEIRELFPVGDDRVLAWMNLRAEGRGGAIALSGDLYTCYWMRWGRFFRVEDHLTLSGALRAFGLEGETLETLGLSEQDARADS